jgi:hypothetical protein
MKYKENNAKNYFASEIELIIKICTEMSENHKKTDFSLLTKVVTDTEQTLFAVHEMYSGEYDTISSSEKLTLRIISLTDSMAFTCSVVVFIRIC